MEPASIADINHDGVVTDSEMNKTEKLLELEQRQLEISNEDARQDAQRKMAWFALFGMLLYPFAVVIAISIGLDQAAKILGDMAATYFVSVAAIVAAFYGKEAFVSARTQSNSYTSRIPVQTPTTTSTNTTVAETSVPKVPVKRSPRIEDNN